MKLVRIIAVTVLLSIQAAKADIIRWQLQDAILEDGSTLTGFFEFDADVGVYYPLLNAHQGKFYDFDLRISAGPAPFSAFEYTPATAHLGYVSSSNPQWTNDDGDRFLLLRFSHSILGGEGLKDMPIGSTIFLRIAEFDYAGGSFETSSNTQRFFASGSVIAVSSEKSRDPIIVPEATQTLWMMLGLIAVAIFATKRPRRFDDVRGLRSKRVGAE